MKNRGLTDALCDWIAQTYNHPEWRDQNHCFAVRRDVRLPETGPVDAISVAHRSPSAHGDPDVFCVGLWEVESGAIDVAALDRMNRHLQVFEAWYSEFLEAAHCRGFTSRHRLQLTGNLVGASVVPDPLLDLLSHWGRGVSFWTYERTGSVVEVEPYTGVARSLRPARRRLADLLHHLRWRDLEVAATQEVPR